MKPVRVAYLFTTQLGLSLIVLGLSLTMYLGSIPPKTNKYQKELLRFISGPLHSYVQGLLLQGGLTQYIPTYIHCPLIWSQYDLRRKVDSPYYSHNKEKHIFQTRNRAKGLHLEATSQATMIHVASSNNELDGFYISCVLGGLPENAH